MWNLFTVSSLQFCNYSTVASEEANQKLSYALIKKIATFLKLVSNIALLHKSVRDWFSISIIFFPTRQENEVFH